MGFRTEFAFFFPSVCRATSDRVITDAPAKLTTAETPAAITTRRCIVFPSSNRVDPPGHDGYERLDPITVDRLQPGRE
jgi:hypothetical protein